MTDVSWHNEREECEELMAAYDKAYHNARRAFLAIGEPDTEFEQCIATARKHLQTMRYWGLMLAVIHEERETVA